MISEQEESREAYPMVKRTKIGYCVVCQKVIEIGEECFYKTFQVLGFKYLSRKYYCKRCHDST